MVKGLASIASRKSFVPTPMVRCGLKFEPQAARSLWNRIKLGPQHVGADHDRDGQVLHALGKLKQHVAMFFNSFNVQIDSKNRLCLAA